MSPDQRKPESNGMEAVFPTPLKAFPKDYYAKDNPFWGLWLVLISVRDAVVIISAI